MQPTKTRREQDVNFGDRTKLSGASGVKTLAWINVDESEPFTVYAEARLTGPAAILPHIVPLVTLDWGAGTATMAAEHRIVGRLRVPLVASFIRVEGRLMTDQGQPAPAGVIAEVSAFIACGTDGETRHNARAVVQTGDNGVLSERSERVLAVAGYNGGATPLWMMLFEGPVLPAAGAVPRMAAPAPAGGSFRMRPTSPREFVGGVAWAASAAPLTLAPAAGAAFFVEAEILP